MKLHDLVDEPEKLETYGKYVSYEMAYAEIRNGSKDQRLIDVISKDPERAYFYAKNILKGSFPQGEKAIATSIFYAHAYANNVLKSRFQLGENIISESFVFSYLYAKDILRGRFLKGEKAIAKDPYYAKIYAKEIIKGPWPKAGIK